MDYTEGEWQITEHDGKVRIYDIWDRILAKLVDGGYEELRANAHLIAAAPKMYEALEFLLTGKREDGRYDKHDAAGFIKIAEEALAEIKEAT